MLRYSTAFVLAPLLSLVAAPAALAQIDQISMPSPLQRAQQSALPAQLAPVVSALTSDPAAWAQVHGDQAVRFTAVPLGPSRDVTLLLQRIQPFTSDAIIVEVVTGPKGQLTERTLPIPDADYFTGTIEGDPESRVMLSHSAAGVHGYVQDASGTFVISSGPPLEHRPIVSYNLAELPEGSIAWQAWPCEARAGGQVFLDPSEGGVAGTPPCRQAKIAVETDYEFTGLFGGNTTLSTAYAGTIFAGVYDIYSRDLAVRPQVNYLRVWATASDPWNAANSGAELDEFSSYWTGNMGSLQRTTAHFLSGRGLGGGVAYLSSLCNGSAYGVSGNLGGYFPYPLIDNNAQNWDIMVVSHEIGHNFGAPHTHDYCPPADECAPSGYFGQCQTQQTCINTGTLMSYCHLCSGGLANVRLLFHPSNIDSIQSYLGATCDLTGAAQPPVGVYDHLTVARGVMTDLDVTANEIALNCEAFTITSAPATSTQGGAITVVHGGGPGGRDILQYLSPPTFTGQDYAWYRLTDASNQESATIIVYLDVQALRFPENPVGDVPGLTARYYALTSPSVLPNFDALTPYLNTTVTQVNYASTNGNFANSNRSDNVGARWTGWVKVDQPGYYTFTTNSDDGSSLKIGDTTVVSNDGLHGMLERGGTIGLLPGRHAITMDFFEAGGGAGCIVSLSGPGITKAPIPASRFTRGGTVNPYDLNGDGHVDGADLGILLAAFGSSSANSDFNHDGLVDGADLGALLASWGP